MIDLHSHLLPNIDDGADSVAMALDMARIAVADGTTVLACTPHIQAGVYDNSDKTIFPAIEALQRALDENEIPLQLVAGADAHITPALPKLLASGHVPTLAGSRYFLFEPPHHVCPPNVIELAKTLLKDGYVPVLTHPERLTWIERDYAIIEKLDELGVAVQVTAASLTGRFGEVAKTWALRMLDEGRVDIIASDAHSPKHRPPGLSAAFALIEERMDTETAERLCRGNPQLILDNGDLPSKTRKNRSPKGVKQRKPKGLFDRIFGK